MTSSAAFQLDMDCPAIQVKSATAVRKLNTVKFHFIALGLYNLIRGFGQAYKWGGGWGGLVSGWAYKRRGGGVKG